MSCNYLSTALLICIENILSTHFCDLPWKLAAVLQWNPKYTRICYMNLSQLLCMTLNALFKMEETWSSQPLIPAHQMTWCQPKRSQKMFLEEAPSLQLCSKVANLVIYSFYTVVCNPFHCNSVRWKSELRDLWVCAFTAFSDASVCSYHFYSP